MKIQFKDTDRVTLNFLHINTNEESSIVALRNPSTGNWLRIEKIGDRETAYYSDKNDIKRLIKTIITKNTEKGLKAELTVKSVKIS